MGNSGSQAWSGASVLYKMQGQAENTSGEHRRGLGPTKCAAGFTVTRSGGPVISLMAGSLVALRVSCKKINLPKDREERRRYYDGFHPFSGNEGVDKLKIAPPEKGTGLSQDILFF